MPAPVIKSKPNLISFAKDPMFFVFESDKFIGSEVPYEATHANLSLYCEVWEYNKENDTESILVTLQVPYNPYTKEAVVDIHSIQELKSHLPVLTDKEGRAADVYSFLFIKFADQFGTPVVPETLEVDNRNEAYYSIINGSALQSIGNQGGFALHAYKNTQGKFFAKQVTTEQPDWLYFWLAGDGLRDVSIGISLFYEDGTSDLNHSVEVIQFEGKAVHWISTSYKDRIESITTAKKVIAYQFTLSQFLSGGFYILAHQKYVLDQCSDKDFFIAYDNGLGGIESLRLRGDTTHDVDVVNDIFNKVQYGKIDQKNGHLSTFNNNFQESINTNTGYYDEDYIYHIAQIIGSECWLINGDEFVSIYCTSKSAKGIKNNDVDLLSLPLSFKFGFKRLSHNNLHHSLI